MTTSLADNQTHVLWRTFMPRRREITRVIGSELYSIERYGPAYFERFDPQARFEKWAAVEVPATTTVPEGWETLTTPEGLYAVFVHRGPASAGPTTYQFILGTWLPQSTYVVDHRPHFAVMGERYKGEDPDSEEELWIPITKKV
ncbi:AraC family transcriptional regulator [Catalinimonas alkaloidigena]|uniref:AraC family transcriptional regulator n=2 Tax=Catalinimonas alkaloidigena TaxID=1075417 RepID=A0A1G9EG07_9BACT|nr:AraC family transcriptional regulator [Catalinimonas alkaloidigena]